MFTPPAQWNEVAVNIPSGWNLVDIPLGPAPLPRGIQRIFLWGSFGRWYWGEKLQKVTN